MTLKPQLKTSVATLRTPESPRDEAAPPKTLTIPEAGWIYYGLSKNGSYDAAARGEIPFIVVGRLKKVSVARMEQIMADGVGPVVSPPPIEAPAKPVKALAKSSKGPRSIATSIATRRRDHQLESVD
jgi:hypothetical protein